MAKNSVRQPGDNHEAWAEQHLQKFRDHLAPSASFHAQAKASLFQKIEADRAQYRRGWHLFPKAWQRWTSILAAASVLAGLLFSGPLFAPKITLAYVGEFGAIEGTVYIHRADGTVLAQARDKIFEGDTIEVTSASKAAITIAGEAQAELSENTKIHVQDVISIDVDRDLIASQVRLQLQQGTYVQKKTEARNDAAPTVITLATPSGTIKSSAYADYIVSADDHAQVALSVHSNGVTVLRDGEDASLATGKIVQEGQSVLLDNSRTDLVVFATTDLQTATGSLIATITQAPERVAESIKTTVTPAANAREVITANANTNTLETTTPLIETPTAPSFDLTLNSTLDSLQTRLEIAEVKIQQAIDFHQKGAEQEARIAMAGYVNTAKDIYRILDEGASQMKTTVPDSLDAIVQQSPVISAYDSLIAKTGADKSSDTYKKTLNSLELLSRAEAALRIDIAGTTVEEEAVDPQEEQPTAMMTAPADDTARVAETSASTQASDVRTYTKKVQTGIYGEVEAIVADADTKSRTNAFIALLGRIPNEKRNIPMLERIQSMVPQALRGFVAVKIHRIQYPEAQRN